MLVNSTVSPTVVHRARAVVSRLTIALLVGSIAQSASAVPSFQDVAPIRGLTSTGTTYGGAWVPDINGDGRPDLWSANHSSADDPVLYLSSGADDFVIAPPSTFQGLGSRDFHGSGWADIDNDGDRDLLVVAGAGKGATAEANMLLVNNGNGTFVESAVAYGIDYPFARSRDLLWLDWNNDGFLDVLLLNRNDRTEPPDAKTQIFTYDPQSSSYVEESFALDQFVEQLWGQLSFNNPALGGAVPAFITVARKGNTVVDRAFSYGAGGLTDVEADLAVPGVGFANDSAMGDFNNDGAQDMVVVNNSGVHLLLQSATGFALAPGPTGLSTNLAAFVVAEDFNNDMWLDIYVSRSNPGPDTNLPNLLFLNQGDGTFVPVPSAGGAEGTSEGYVAATATVDYNNDGLMDVYNANSDNWWAPRELTVDAPMQLFENQDVSGNHWLKIELHGTVSNADGIGASVWVTAGGVTQLREMNGGLHARTQDDSRLHFGLASETVATTVTVNWPSGITQTFSAVSADQILHISETSGSANIPPTAEFDFSTSSAPLTVNFNGQSSFDPEGPVVSWIWDFGDNTTGQGSSPSHTYASPGIYTVTLTVSDVQGAMNTIAKDVVASSSSTLVKLNIAPQGVGANAFKKARLVDEQSSGAQDLSTYWNSNASLSSSWVTFDLAASETVSEVLVAPRASAVVNFEIFVGDTLVDGAVSGTSAQTCTVPISGVSQQPSTLFTCPLTAATGRFVTLRIPNAKHQRIYGVEIYAASGGTNQSPSASFTASPLSGESPLTVDVDAGSSMDPDGSISNYDWDFGNGDSASGVQASAVYADAGDYAITLTVTDDEGASAQTSQQISVQGSPVAPEITQQPLSVAVTEGEGASFSVTATGTAPISYQWLRDSVWIPDETGPELSLSNVQLADDGAIFEIMVSNAAGQETSDPAILSVTEGSAGSVKQMVVVQAVGASAFKGPRAIDELGSGEQQLSTNWGSGSGLNNGWITLDMGGVETVQEVRLGMGPNRNYDVEITVGSTLSGGKAQGAPAQTCSTSIGSGFNPSSLTSCTLVPSDGRYVTFEVPSQKFVRFHGIEVYVAQ